MGEDDKHLNFRVSFLLHQHTAQPHHYTFTLSTTVHINNGWGRLYFLPVKPFHTIIARKMIKGIVKQLLQE